VPARERLVERALIEAGLLGRNDERRLGGIALDAPGAVLVETHPGIGGEDRRAEGVAHRLRRGDGGAVATELTDRVVADAAIPPRHPPWPRAGPSFRSAVSVPVLSEQIVTFPSVSTTAAGGPAPGA
jgi:hypothetical protein